MYLKKIETYGFKSFADKINFDFTPNINGIVGPNGSGKSNVVDAVRWVLGEQSNKQLRADNSSAVIFSGSKSRKPLNSATVNLTFDNSDHNLPLDFSEVSIKRTLYRTGENEYYLNGEKCRLKDITELLTDSGAAKESFNIIGQGKIDEILSTKPYDRRIIFEEAAGVLKYKRRKEEALRKLERTNTNINRVNDIINELETNLSPLEEQSKKAKKYLDSKEKLTIKEISLMIHDVDIYSGEFKDSKEKITTLTDEITLLNKNNANYDVDILTSKEKLSKLEENLSNKQNKILSLTKEQEQTNTEIKLLKERKKYFNIDAGTDKINNLKEEKSAKEYELNNITNDIEIINQKITNASNELTKNSQKYQELKDEIVKLNSKITSTNHEATDISYRISFLEESINNGGALPQSIKSILNNPKFTGIENTIGSLINMEQEYALAVSTALQSSANYLVVDTKKTASELINYLKDNHLGRATFFPLEVIKPRYIDSDTMEKLTNSPGYINTMDKLVTYKEKYTNIILNQLGNVLLVDNINNANEISKKINNRYKIVTLDGQVVNVGGSITGGDKIKSNDSIHQRYELEELGNKLIKIKNTIKNYQKDISEKEKAANTIESLVYSANIAQSSLNELIKRKQEEKENLTNSLNELNSEIKDLEKISTSKENSEENILITKYYKIGEEITNLEKETNMLKLEKDRLSKELSEIENTSKTDLEHITKLEKELKDNEIKSSKLEVKIDTILNSLNEDYSITYSEAKEKYILTDEAEKTRTEVSTLKNIIKDIGIVNIGAIEEYERVSTRYNFLSKQKEDLSKAEDTLLEIINDMDSIMKEKFATTFEEIRIEFQKVFRELFHGGTANIYLTDPDNLLETGIELEATPPGKTLKNISALSGGEKTFTAISLLFAILNIRPVPFCLFDEVEAALDEANVDAFGEYLNKYRDKTQFIIITHKKKTMEFINTLYGITMQESGVSKLVSVKLDNLK